MDNCYKFFAVLLLAFSHMNLYGFTKYPQIPVMYGFVENYHEEKDESIFFPTGATTKEKIEGTKTFKEFECKKAATHPHAVQILKYHFNTITKLGGYMVYRSSMFATFRVTLDGRNLAVIVETYHDGLQYTLTIIDVGSAGSAKAIPADEIFSKLTKEGHVAFYFNFQSGESELTSDANKGISEIAKMMKEHPSLTLVIEGHTDNVGKPEDNIRLSEKRAETVKKALIKAGVPSARLISKGVGQANPIASNDTSSGRERNRRVELVRKK